MTQSDFDLSRFLPYRLAVLSDRVSRRLSQEYGPTHGLSVAEWRVLVHLRHSGPVSVREIQASVNMEKSRVSRAVGRLERLGLVDKRPGKSDARLVRISLTAAGHRVLTELLPRASRIEAQLVAGLTDAERIALDRIIEKLHARLDQDPLARPRNDILAARAK